MQNEIDRQAKAGDNTGKYYIFLQVDISTEEDGKQYDICDTLQAESFSFDNVTDKAKFNIQIITSYKPKLSLLQGLKIKKIKVSNFKGRR